ncbi:MAG TPA: M48 family metalloprotease [Pyrinomonadaceae bacterium]|nr:M48 family metalloprotease [Pyrinomonadaceae bacterium]
MYELLGISLALAALLCVNALITTLVGGVWRLVSGRVRYWPARARAQAIFVLRTSPAALSISFVLALLVPSYLAYEPLVTTEHVSVKLALLAMFAISGLILALWRGFSAWLATRRLLNDWLENSVRVELEGVTIPAFRIEHAFPVIAVVGALRPRLFIASHLLESLSAQELCAAIAHERGHLNARDNLKRALMRACRDALVIVPSGRALDRAWAEAAEAAADEYTARAGAHVSLDLAAALIKIARLVPKGAKPTMPAGAFLVGEDHGVEDRVRNLINLAEFAREGGGSTVQLKLLNWLFVALFAALISASANQQSLSAIHALTESIVHALN